MKQKLIFFFTACLLSFTTQAQTPETEPNNTSTDAGVQTITTDGSYSGNFSFTDLEYYRIAPNTGGTITVTFTNAPAANGIFLAPYPSGSSLANTSNPGSFTYVLNPLSNYMLYTGTGTATGNWKFTISGLSAVSASVAGSNVLCYGGSNGTATVTASGAAPFTYSWSPAGGTSSVATGLLAGNYSVLVTNAAGVSVTKTLSIAQPAPLTLTATASSASVCAGETVTLTANSEGGTGTITYTWAPGFHSTTYTVAPSINTIYTVNISDINGCTAASSVSITAGPVPTLAVNNATICSGALHTIVPSGAASYTITGNNFTVTPASTTTYSITGAGANGCMATNTAVATVLVNILPTITVNNMAICSGQSATLVPGGASTYTITGANFTVSPTSTTSYSVTGTDSNGCLSSNTAIATVTVNQTPTLTVNNATICSGALHTIVPSGAASYTITGNNFTVTPASTTTYSITGAGANGCMATNTAVATVLVNILPTITVNNMAICSGQSATLVPGGASTYTITGANFTVSPASTTSYSVTGTDSNGCLSSNTAIATVTVNQTPTLTVNNATICSGSSATLIPAGTDTYSITGGSFTVSPSINTTFFVTGTSTAGCISLPVTATVLVNALPTVTAASSNATICVGESATLTAGGAITYSWSSLHTTPEVVVSSSLALSQGYTVTGTDANGCANTATLTQVIDLCTGLSPTSNEVSSVSLFPNPSSGQMTAQFNFEGRKEITIIDGTGRTVLTLITHKPSQVIDLSSYAKGIYVAQLRSGALIKTVRIVLQE